MNRRNFIGTILAAGAGFTILPGTGRIWKAVRRPFWELRWVPSTGFNGEPNEVSWLMESYLAWSKARNVETEIHEIYNHGYDKGIIIYERLPVLISPK